jgi:hypothetical protein
MAENTGYHVREIPKGVLGEFSKIVEEYTELLDAHEQNSNVLEICELTDLIGAIRYYAENKFNLSLEDLIKFSMQTENAFKNGKR